MKSPLQETERNIVSEQAARWLALLAEGNPAERAAFTQWLKQSPRNVEEFLFTSAALKTFTGTASRDPVEVERIVAAALAAKPTENVVPWIRDMPEAEDALLTDTRRAPRWSIGLAAVISLAALGWVFRANIASVVMPHMYVTAVGEQRTVRLPDGSLIFLNAQSRIEFDYNDTARDLELSEGEAVFKVAHDTTRPFRVHTRDALVQAVGTQFNVYRRPEGTTVSVLEGRVRVSSGNSDTANLAAGEEAKVVSTGKVLKQAQPNVAASIAWRQRRLVFRADRLEDIAAEFSRYSPRRIALQDDMARNKRITGTFDADDPASLVQFLEELNELSVKRGGDNFIISGR